MGREHGDPRVRALRREARVMDAGVRLGALVVVVACFAWTPTVGYMAAVAAALVVARDR
jgi:hypothetical protein